jgi:hypothetical protein
MSAQQPSSSNSDADPRFEIGDRVVDDDDPDPDIARVINKPGIPAKDWDSHPDKSGEQLTVADCNPEYDPTDLVVVCLFEEQLSEYYPDWDGESPLSLDEVTGDGITHYAFPKSRLSITPSREDTRPEPPDGLIQLAEDIRSGATVDVVWSDNQWNLEINKLGIEYLISATGEIHGQGPHRDDFERMAAAAL